MFDLAGLEERLTKSGLDVCFEPFVPSSTNWHGRQRAKSENKFYAAMRDKEAIEAERKNLARNSEKQAKLIDRLMDTERNLTNQLVGYQLLSVLDVSSLLVGSARKRATAFETNW